jgi:hypothetical protein
VIVEKLELLPAVPVPELLGLGLAAPPPPTVIG